MSPRSIRILIVEDNPGDVRLLEELLRFSGGGTFELEHADHLAAGFQRLADNAFDLIMLDLGLPDSQGLGTLRRMLAKAYSTPIVILTGLCDEETAFKALQEGAQDYLIKGDVNPALLGRLIRYAIERKRAQNALRLSDEKYRTLIENLRLGVIMISTDLEIMTMNRQLCEWFPAVLSEHSRCWQVFGLRTDACLSACPACQTLRNGSVVESVVSLERDGKMAYFRMISMPVKDELERISAVITTVEDITERYRTEAAQARLTTAVEQAAEVIIITDRGGVIQYVNPAFEKISGYSAAEVQNRHVKYYQGVDQKPEVMEGMHGALLKGETWSGRLTSRRKDGSQYTGEGTASPVRDRSGEVVNYVCILRDVTEQLQMEVHLRQAQKLESIGQLAAGIAHEINTPTQYVGDNIRFLQDGFRDLLGLLQSHDAALRDLSVGKSQADVIASLEASSKSSDLDYLMEEIPRAIQQSLEGIDRVATIVRAMKEFSHPGSEEKTFADLNKAIQNTITVARNEWKYVAHVETDMDDNLPPIPCLQGELNQVFLNLIINAAHAVAGVVGDGSDRKGVIRISTHYDGECAEIRIADSGTGIPEEIRSRIFDPFFTTKDVGKGTGQGLPIARSVVVDKHGGAISFETEVGAGTTFIIRLPAHAEQLELEAEDA